MNILCHQSVQRVRIGNRVLIESSWLVLIYGPPSYHSLCLIPVLLFL